MKWRPVLWVVALALFLWTLSRVSLSDAWVAVSRLSPIALAALVGLNLFALVVFGARWWVILRALGRPIGLLDASLYRLAAFGFSYFTPGPQVGGEPAQVLLAERRHEIPRDVAIASVGLDRLFDGVVNLSFLVAAAFIAVDGGGALVLSVLVAIPLAYLWALGCGRTPLAALVPKDVVRKSETEAGRFCRERPRALAAAVALSFASWGMLLLEYWMLVFFLEGPLTWKQLVLGLAAARVAYLLLLPAGLGVLEAGQVAAVQAMGFSPALGLSVSLVIRLRDVVVASFGLWWGMKALTTRDR